MGCGAAGRRCAGADAAARGSWAGEGPAALQECVGHAQIQLHKGQRGPQASCDTSTAHCTGTNAVTERAGVWRGSQGGCGAARRQDWCCYWVKRAPHPSPLAHIAIDHCVPHQGVAEGQSLLSGARSHAGTAGQEQGAGPAQLVPEASLVTHHHHGRW